MAIITCPNCGGQVSDRAKKCVHCGAVLDQEKMKYCPECGGVLEGGASICGKCGCPVDASSEIKSEPDTPQQVQLSGVRVSKGLRRGIVAIAVVVTLVVAIVFGVGQVQKKRAEKEAAKRSEEYAENMEYATYLMLSGAGDAETCGNLIKRVWYNAIYEEQDYSTDKYTRPTGVIFVSDFNDALQNLFADKSFSSQISGIKENQETVKALVKKLKNPPDEYEDAHEAILKFYDAYLSLTNLVTNPTGSLQTFSSNFNDADSEVLKCFKAVQLYLED